jgi:hypothetical protein
MLLRHYQPHTIRHLMSDKQPNNPLHGITLESLLSQLVSLYGWQGLSERLPLNCFAYEPSLKSSLIFLRKTPWARQKVEALYLASQDASLMTLPTEAGDEPRKILSRPKITGKNQGEKRPRQGYRTDREPQADGERSFRRDGDRPQGERSFRRDGDRPQGERNFRRDGDRPQGERSFRRDGDRPQGERSFRRDGDRPQGERNFRRDGDRPQGERSFRRDGDRPFRDHSDPVQRERALQQQEGQRRQGQGRGRFDKGENFSRSGERQHGREHHHAGHSQRPSRAPKPATPGSSPWGKPKKEQDAE